MMGNLDQWKLFKKFTVTQAALLIIGQDPSNEPSIEGMPPFGQPEGYEEVKASLINSISSNDLHAKVEFDADRNTLNWRRTTISYQDLKAWIKRNDIASEFFLPKASDRPDYLNPAHPRYSAKLAAAVNACGLLPINWSRHCVKNLIKIPRQGKEVFA